MCLFPTSFFRFLLREIEFSQSQLNATAQIFFEPICGLDKREFRLR